MNLVCGKCGGTDHYLTTEQGVRGMGWAATGRAIQVKKCKKCDVNMISAEELPATPEDRKKAVRTLWMFGAAVVLFILLTIYTYSV
jgi:hypothetical protein